LKRAVYTTLFGNYDSLANCPLSTGIDFILFTDVPDLPFGNWEVRLCKDYTGCKEIGLNWLKNRYFKMHPHIILHEYDQTLYIDANIVLLSDPSSLFDKYLSTSDIAIPPHLDRRNIVDELDECLRSGKVTTQEFEFITQRIRYYSNRFPILDTMTENSVILRRNTPAIEKAMNVWWEETLNGVNRDQISLSYALNTAQVVLSPMDEGPRKKNFFTKLKPHWENGKRKNIIYYMRMISTLKHRSAVYHSIDRITQVLILFYKYLIKN
jgi:hypothetical protein